MKFLIMTPPIDISPHLASPEGEGQILLLPDYQSVIDIQGNQLLPYGGEREGADVHWLRKGSAPTLANPTKSNQNPRIISSYYQ